MSPAEGSWIGPAPQEVCIVMLSAIGDAVHVLPVANAIKRTWPKCRVTWVVQPAAHALVAGHPAIDDFVVFRRRRGLRGLSAFQEVADNLRDRSFDILLGLQVYLKAGVITGMARAKVKLGFDLRRARDAQWMFTNTRIPPHAPQHVQDQYFEFLEYLGVDPHPVDWGLALTETEREAQASFFAKLDRPVCAVVVSTSRPEKDWLSDRYARVLEQVESTYGLLPLIVGGASARERQVAEAIRTVSRARIVDALGDDLRRLVWLLDGSALVVTPDTGPLHIARALGKPVVSLFGYTNPRRTGPYRAFEDLVVDGYAEFEGEPYPISAKPRNGMRRVSVEGVMAKIDLAMTKYVRP